jgi:hypothetical protein
LACLSSLACRSLWKHDAQQGSIICSLNLVCAGHQEGQYVAIETCYVSAFTERASCSSEQGAHSQSSFVRIQYNCQVFGTAAAAVPTMLPPLGEPPGPAEPTDDEEHPEDGELQDELANWAMTVPCTRLFALRLIDSACQ